MSGPSGLLAAISAHMISAMCCNRGNVMSGGLFDAVNLVPDEYWTGPKVEARSRCCLLERRELTCEPCAFETSGFNGKGLDGSWRRSSKRADRRVAMAGL